MSASLPPQAELDALAKENRAPAMIAGIVTLSVVAVLSLPFRLWAQKRGKGRWWWDDAFIVFGTVLALVVAISACLQFHWAAGRHILTLVTSSADPLPNIIKWLKAGWVETVFWGLSLCFIKFSVLLFYYRIFAVAQPKLKIAMWVVMAYIASIGIVTLFDEIFQCVPVKYFWEIGYLFVGQTPPVDGVCKDLVARGVLMAAFNIASDVLVLAIPIAGIWHLQMATERKFAVAGMFVLGAACTVISIVRIPYLLTSSLSDDATWANSYPILFMALEPVGGVLCANLMCMAPLYRSKNRNTSQGSSQGSSWASKSRQSLAKMLHKSKGTQGSGSENFRSKISKNSSTSDRSENSETHFTSTARSGYDSTVELNAYEHGTVDTTISAATPTSDLAMGTVKTTTVTTQRW